MSQIRKQTATFEIPIFFTKSYHVNDIMASAYPNFVAEEWTLNTTLGEIKRSG